MKTERKNEADNKIQQNGLTTISKKLILFCVLTFIIYCVAITFFRTQRKANDPMCKDCNILWVSLDTLSANHLSCYGYERQTAPNLCNFARNNFMFENAYSNSYWTLPSFISEFTGLYPSTHKVFDTGDLLSKDLPVLPEILKKNGYTNNFRTVSKDRAVPVDFFINRGLDSHEFIYPWKNSLKEFSDSVKEGKKTFLFMHDYSVHPPYLTEDRPKLYTKDDIPTIPSKSEDLYTKQSPEFFKYLAHQLPLDIDLGKIEKGKLDDLIIFLKDDKNDIEAKNKYFSELIKTDLIHYLFGYIFWFDWEQKIDVRNERQLEYIKALYDQKIHELDQWNIAELISLINEDATRNNTILIISSEHGEEFGEHGEITHKTIYNSNIRIPFIMYVPGFKGKIITTSVQLVDIAPTILDLIGVKNDYNFQGKSLVPLMKGQNFNNRIVEINSDKLIDTALIRDNLKLFLRTRNEIKTYALYDLSNDKDEKNNILFSNLESATDIVDEYKAEKEKWDQKQNQ